MIKFVTKFDPEVATQMNRHTIKKNLWVYIAATLLIALCGLLRILNDSVAEGVALIAIGVLLFPACMWIARISQKKISDSLSLMSDETIETFIFTPENVTIIDEKGVDYHAETVAKYNYFYRVEETPTHYFLYISKLQAHVVPKGDLVEGSLEELNGIFQQNLGANFKLKK